MIIPLNESLLKVGNLYDHLNDPLYYPLIVQHWLHGVGIVEQHTCSFIGANSIILSLRFLGVK